MSEEVTRSEAIRAIVKMSTVVLVVLALVAAALQFFANLSVPGLTTGLFCLALAGMMRIVKWKYDDFDFDKVQLFIYFGILLLVLLLNLYITIISIVIALA